MAEIIEFPGPSEIDLGSGFKLRFADWAPDREIPANNERYKDIPDVKRISAIVTCAHGIEGVIHLDRGEIYKTIFGDRPWWTVVQENPLTLEPSIQTGCCHGWIRNGKWVTA
jgi:Family of unknown function (DUF6527)